MDLIILSPHRYQQFNYTKFLFCIIYNLINNIKILLFY
nr:MAG TPA: hypothetical protein [Caudoviricetes sp.]